MWWVLCYSDIGAFCFRDWYQTPALSAVFICWASELQNHIQAICITVFLGWSWQWWGTSLALLLLCHTILLSSPCFRKEIKQVLLTFHCPWFLFAHPLSREISKILWKFWMMDATTNTRWDTRLWCTQGTPYHILCSCKIWGEWYSPILWDQPTPCCVKKYLNALIIIFGRKLFASFSWLIAV